MSVAKKKSGDVAAADRALLFELDFMAVSGWSTLYDVLKSVLSEHGVKLGLPMFVRYFAGKSVGAALKQISVDFEKPELGGSEVLESVREAYAKAIVSKSEVNDGFAKILLSTRKRGAMIGAVTCLDDETVAAILEKVGLSPDDIHIMESEYCGRAAPTAQDWLRIAKEMEVPASSCTVAVTSALSCKAALCAGMSCFAAPVRLTAYQDFSGADYVFDELDGGAEKLVRQLIDGV